MSFPTCCLFAMIALPVHAHSPKICLDGLICADQVLTPNGALTTVFSITGIKSRTSSFTLSMLYELILASPSPLRLLDSNTTLRCEFIVGGRVQRTRASRTGTGTSSNVVHACGFKAEEQPDESSTPDQQQCRTRAWILTMSVDAENSVPTSMGYRIVNKVEIIARRLQESLCEFSSVL